MKRLLKLSGKPKLFLLKSIQSNEKLAGDFNMIEQLVISI
jgi:hypothetical protein